ncbi:DNA-processing protein DprA [Bacillus cereus]|uniref:DNA-processing protein DprA n=1 Tax=Bacillus cereus TaxID=1396 RepID=UPI000BFCE2A4|nr:DNA-processing protein DprA [Bacillus cereus]MED2870422.1 DNA-processing protein DprA [Bacillus thuringiensis]PGO95945.1 DNA processing protein DprA [Bacillus cereus]
MVKNVRSELFFLKQFGFNNILLQNIFLLGIDPIEIIFNKGYKIYAELESKFTDKDKKLAENYYKYREFKSDLFKEDDFLRDSISKIYFKYDVNEITELMPEKIMPLFMYSKGDISLLDVNQKRVAIVGTRHPSEKAIAITKKLTRKFVEDNYVIVSGLAEGIDTVSHETAIVHKGKTIAVLPTNFKKIYPKENQKLAKTILHEGLLLTSIGPKENTYKSSFLNRNKYIANISDIVVVTETNLKSGTMNTIRNASEASKKILFVDQEDELINNKIYEFGGEMLND